MAHKVYCSACVGWEPAHLCVCSPQASPDVLCTSNPVGGILQTLRIGPEPSHHEEQMLCCLNLLFLPLLVPDLRPGRLILCGPWLHTQCTSINSVHMTMASELRRHDPLFKEERRPPLRVSCKAFCNSSLESN